MRQGKDVAAMLPYLSRYMGHATFDSTYIQAQGYERQPQQALSVNDVGGLEEVPVPGRTSLWRGVAIDAAKHGQVAVVIGIKKRSLVGINKVGGLVGSGAGQRKQHVQLIGTRSHQFPPVHDRDGVLKSAAGIDDRIIPERGIQLTGPAARSWCVKLP